MKDSKRSWIVKTPRKKIRTAGSRTGHPFYSSTPWRKFRQRYISDLEREQMLDTDPKLTPAMKGDIMKYCPVCEVCLKQLKYKVIGRPSQGKELHHIKDINPANAYKTEGFGEPLDQSNVQLLCRHHHLSESMKKKEGLGGGM